MTLRFWAPAVAIFGAIAALVGAPAASADVAEDYFLNELYKTHVKWYGPYGEQWIIGMGRGVCDAWTNNVPYVAEVDGLATANNWTHRSTRFFIALATAAFCPDQYAARLPPEGRLPDGK